MTERQIYDTGPNGRYKILNPRTGTPFSTEWVTRDLDRLRGRIHIGKASLLIVDGAIGEGKTTLAVELGSEFQGSSVDLSKQYAMGGEQFQEKLQICIDSQLKVIIYDEAGDFNKRGALTKFNKQLNRIFETFRTYGILVVLALPSMHVLDNDLFTKGIPRVLYHCYGRTQSYGRFKAYSLWRMYWIRHKMHRMIVKPNAYKMTSPNYHGRFYNLPSKQAAALAKLSTEGKKEILTQNVLENRGLKSYKEIGRKIGRSTDWTRRKILELGIKPKATHKRRKYFDASIIPQLEDEKGQVGGAR